MREIIETLDIPKTHWNLLYSTLKNLACGYPELLATIHDTKKYTAKIRARVVWTVTSEVILHVAFGVHFCIIPVVVGSLSSFTDEDVFPVHL